MLFGVLCMYSITMKRAGNFCIIKNISTVIHCIININRDLDWVGQTSIKFKSQLNLKCKLILCTFQVNVSIN